MEISKLELEEEFVRLREQNQEAGYREFAARNPGFRESELELILLGSDIAKAPSLEQCERFFAINRSLNNREDYKDEYTAVVRALISLKSGGLRAYLLLYDESKEVGILYKAWKEDLAKDETEEFQLLSKLPLSELAVAFQLVPTGDQDMRVGSDTSLSGTETSTIRPKIGTKVQSTARFARVRVHVEMQLPVSYKKYWAGITWFAPPDSETKYWKGTFKADAWFDTPPQGDSGQEFFDFQRFEISRRTVAAGLAGFITEASLEETIISIVGIQLVQ